MAGASLLTLLDDIASILDDVAVMTKLAAKKTAGVLGDDLALNAQQVSGVTADRELPVVWAVAKGSALNKLILVPAALLISAVAPWAIVPVLMLGGAFLCYEGFHKLAHKFLPGDDEAAHRAEHMRALQDAAVDIVAFEREKVKAAIRTDFILSAEIIVIALGTVAGADLARQLIVLSAVSIVMTIGVYGLVAGIVKLDDAGLYLHRRPSRLAQGFGTMLLGFAPRLMKTLSVAGTAAMFMVGGGILVHGIAPLHHAIGHLGASTGVAGSLLAALLNALSGVVAGGVTLAAVLGAQWLFRRAPKAA